MNFKRKRRKLFYMLQSLNFWTGVAHVKRLLNLEDRRDKYTGEKLGKAGANWLSQILMDAAKKSGVGRSMDRMQYMGIFKSVYRWANYQFPRN